MATGCSNQTFHKLRVETGAGLRPRQLVAPEIRHPQGSPGQMAHTCSNTNAEPLGTSAAVCASQTATGSQPGTAAARRARRPLRHAVAQAGPGRRRAVGVDESRNTGEDEGLCWSSRFRKSSPTTTSDPATSAELCESYDRRVSTKARARLRAASLQMLPQEPDVDPARVPETTGAPIRRHRRRDRDRLDGVGDQPSPRR